MSDIRLNVNSITLNNIGSGQTSINLKGEGISIDNKLYANDDVIFNDDTISYGTDKVTKLQFINSNGVDKAYLKYQNAHLELLSSTGEFSETIKTKTVKATNYDILNEDATEPKLRLKADDTGQIMQVMDNSGGEFKNINTHTVYATALLLKENSTDTTGFYFVRDGNNVLLKDASGATFFNFSK